MALFLEIFRIPGFDCVVAGMDHVPLSIQVNRSKRSRFILYWGPVLLYSAVIFWFSSRATIHEIPPAGDKILHFGEYFLFALLLFRALGGKFSGALNFRRTLVLFVISALYAASDEFHQSYVQGRYASIYDWFADVAGILGMITLRLSRVKWRGGAVNYHYEKI
jgi:hypothetical protein